MKVSDLSLDFSFTNRWTKKLVNTANFGDTIIEEIFLLFQSFSNFFGLVGLDESPASPMVEPPLGYRTAI